MEPRPRFIRQLVLLLAVVCAGVLLICPSVANDESLSAKALPGQRYDGTSAGGERIFLRATRGGDRLSTYRLVAATRCDDGRRGFGALDQDGEGPVRVSRDGTFSYVTSRPSAYRLRPGERVTGHSAFELRGRFAPRGYSVSGTLESRFRSRRLRCGSGPVPFRADLDGSPGAPFRSRNVTTGVYSALPEKLERFRLRVFLPARQVSVSFRWRHRCGHAGHGGQESFPAIPLRGRMVAVRRGRARLRLRFSQNGNYLVRGRFRRKIRRRCAIAASFTGVLSPGDARLNLDPSRPLGPP